MPMITPSRTQDADARARGLAAKRGGATKQAAAARTARASRLAELEARIRHALALVHPGEACVPAWDGAFWRALADVTGAKEGELATIGKRLGIWPHSSTQCVLAARLRHGLPDVWEGGDDE